MKGAPKSVLGLLILFVLLSSHPAQASTSSNLPTDRLYTGQVLDNDTDLYYYHARYYDPILGIFTSADRAQGPNRYAYVNGNPVMRNDPTGNYSPVDAGGGGDSAYGILGGPIYDNYSWQETLSNPQRWMDFGYAVGMTLAGTGLGSAGGPIGAMTGTLVGANMAARRLANAYPRMGIVRDVTGAILNAEAVAVATIQVYQIASQVPAFNSALGKIQKFIADERGSVVLGIRDDSLGELVGICGVGSQGIYAKEGVATKIFNIYGSGLKGGEVEKMKKYGTGELLPEFLGEVPGGYKMRYVSNSVTLSRYNGRIRSDVIERARGTLIQLHSQGFVHGDLNPENVLVQSNSQGDATKIFLIDPWGGNSPARYDPANELSVFDELFKR